MRDHDTARPARVLAYCRVSGREQGERGTSLEDQRDIIERWCRERGYPAPELFVEVESAGEERREKRVELDRVLAAARPGDLIAVTLVDRWSRDVVYGVGSVRKLVGAGIGWVAIEEHIDARTEHGYEALVQRAAGAEIERRRIKRRTVGRRDSLRDQGLYVEGPAPFGYRRGERAARRQLLLEVVESEAKLVRQAYERSAGGASVEAVREWLEVETGRAWDKKRVHGMLRNRVYLGEVRDSRETWISGRHAAIVTRELFQRAQDAMAGRRLGGRTPSDEARTASWLLRGLGSCPDCGARMGAAYSRGTDYYACARRARGQGCSAPYARVEVADAAAHRLALERLAELRHEIARPPSGAAAPSRPDYSRQKADLAARGQRLSRGFVEGVLSAEDVRRERDRLDEQLRRIEVAEAAAARAERAANPGARAVALADLAVLSAAWEAMPVDGRRVALGVLARTIIIRAEGPEIVWRTVEELYTSTGGAHLFGGTDDVPLDLSKKWGRR